MVLYTFKHIIVGKNREDKKKRKKERRP